MNVLQDMGASWSALPLRTRGLLVAAAAVLGLVFTYHVAIAPLVTSTKLQRARHTENLRKLEAVEGASAVARTPSAFAGKTLEPLSAARVVEALTEAAHASGIQRITFKTGATAAVSEEPEEGPTPVTVARMPVKVDIEAQGGDFAAYLENLGNLPMPIAVETFLMRVDEALEPALRIRMELDVYGRPS